jgi:hypothetical protein
MTPQIILDCNSLLLERLGQEHSHPRYQWLDGDDHSLWRPMPEYEPDGSYAHDYTCECGVNRSVHSPSCTHLAIKTVRHRLRNPYPWLINRWVLCKWLPPPSRASWAAIMKNSLPYPLSGFYQPVGDQRKTLALLPGVLPTVTVTLEIIEALKTNPTGKELTGQQIDQWRKQEQKTKAKWKEIAKECMPNSDPDKTATSVYRQFAMTEPKRKNK